MKKLMMIFPFFCVLALSVNGQDDDAWEMFAKVRFEAKLFKEQNTYYSVPVLDEKITSKAGTEITLSGYYMPFRLTEKVLIISRYPYASCFFCGGAGPESIAEIQLLEAKPKFKVDDYLTIKGKLKLNDSDIDHTNFILTEAKIMAKQ